MQPETRVYGEADADLSILEDRTVAIVGYGNQGRSQALNLSDSGVDVVVGNREDASHELAVEDGFDVYPIGEATRRADLVFLLVPDEVAPAVYEEAIEPNLSNGDVIVFASGYNVTYGFVDPAEDVDVVLLAPRMIGEAVRSMYIEGDGAPCFLAVEQDASGQAKARALALAKGIGATRSGVIEGSFEMETTLDLLLEQFVAPVFFSAMLVMFERAREAGVPAEAILLELYLSKEYARTFEKMAEQGVIGQLSLHSRTSQYGQLSRIESFDADPLRAFANEQFRKIDEGEFAREWTLEQETDYPVMEQLYERYRESEFVRAERRTMDLLDLGKNRNE